MKFVQIAKSENLRFKQKDSINNSNVNKINHNDTVNK